MRDGRNHAHRRPFRKLPQVIYGKQIIGFRSLILICLEARYGEKVEINSAPLSSAEGIHSVLRRHWRRDNEAISGSELSTPFIGIYAFNDTHPPALCWLVSVESEINHSCTRRCDVYNVFTTSEQV